MDEESLVAARHEVAGLLVGAVANLYIASSSATGLLMTSSILKLFPLNLVETPSI